MTMNSKFKTALACLLLFTCGQITVNGQDSKDGFVPLFDGKSLNGWKVAEENPQSWKVVDGQLVCEGPRCHLFYAGKLAPFKNFHFIAEVKTTPGSNAGIYFHTKYQATDWPRQGFECQVNVSHKDPKKTSSLYAVDNVADPGVKDNEWYTQEIIVKGKNVVLKVNGKTMVNYTEAEGQAPASKQFERLLGKGTFALQAHDPNSKVYFKNLRVKKLD
ncbi:MAG: glycosyl hydrolase [Rhodopirellula sp.]|nr:glycosyl hydrolase [Rhodopirellula sp.]